MHCSMLAEEAIKKAIEDVKSKNTSNEKKWHF
jgi:NifU-like protein involved in Fe-S cluster formation